MSDRFDDHATTSTIDDLRAMSDVGRTEASAASLEASVRERLHRELARDLAQGEAVRTSSARRPKRRLVLATIAGAAAVVVAGSLTLGGSDAGSGPGRLLGPATADAATVARLGQALATSPAPSGDATLTSERYVIRGDGRSDQTGMRYNLVTDGQSLNYFGASLQELRAASAVSATGPDRATGPGTPSGWIEAAAKAGEETPERAAAAIDEASGIPNVGRDAAGRRAQFENHVWVTVLDILELDGGRPDVRAGALKAVAAIDAKVARTTAAGRPALQLSVVNEDAGAGYTETLTIDATTGTPIRFTGGTPGQQPSTASDYTVERVNAADYGH